jgi:hypothetical protein
MASGGEGRAAFAAARFNLRKAARRTVALAQRAGLGIWTAVSLFGTMVTESGSCLDFGEDRSMEPWTHLKP